MLVLNGFFKDNTVVPEYTVSVPDGTKAVISVEDTPLQRQKNARLPEYPEENPEERAFKRSLDPQEQLDTLKKFHNDLAAIDDEPLDEEFDNAVNARLKFTQVDF
jgi:hypothetical protein